MYDLTGRKALITGGANGIGRATALRLAREGCDIALLDREPSEETAAAVRALGREAHVAVGDVTDEASVTAAANQLVKALGPVDVLVNSAGILRLGSLIEMDPKDWRNSFAVNVDGIFWTCRAVLPGMVARKQGRVINMASWLGKKAIANYSAYCASKFAVIGVTQSLAMEMAPHGITVNAVCPGLIVETRMRDESEAQHQALGLPMAKDRVNTIPMGRLGLPNDVARLVCFLASDESDYMTGQSINITGGLWTS